MQSSILNAVINNFIFVVFIKTLNRGFFHEYAIAINIDIAETCYNHVSANRAYIYGFLNGKKKRNYVRFFVSYLLS